jgi:hypothetical protein
MLFSCLFVCLFVFYLSLEYYIDTIYLNYLFFKYQDFWDGGGDEGIYIIIDWSYYDYKNKSERSEHW